MPWVENEEDAEFIRFVRNYNSQNRPQVMELLEKYSDKNIFIFENRNQVNEQELFSSSCQWRRKMALMKQM